MKNYTLVPFLKSVLLKEILRKTMRPILYLQASLLAKEVPIECNSDHIRQFRSDGAKLHSANSNSMSLLRLIYNLNPRCNVDKKITSKVVSWKEIVMWQ